MSHRDDEERLRLLAIEREKVENMWHDKQVRYAREHDGLIDTPVEDLASELDANVLNDDEPTPYSNERYMRSEQDAHFSQQPQPASPSPER